MDKVYHKITTLTTTTVGRKYEYSIHYDKFLASSDSYTDTIESSNFVSDSTIG
jgi:hypothetical protein